jgi:hypothetical protein
MREGLGYVIIDMLFSSYNIQSPQLKDEQQQPHRPLPNPCPQQGVIPSSSRFNEHCIESCVDFMSTGKLSSKEDTCLRNCASKVGQYKKFAKDSGFPIK